MDTNKHTPGPWWWGNDWTDEALGFGQEDFEGEKYADIALRGHGGSPVIPLCVDHYSVELDASKSATMIRPADRRLIAAAPDLLAACEALLDEALELNHAARTIGRGHPEDASDPDCPIEMARVAIARAVTP